MPQARALSDKTRGAVVVTTIASPNAVLRGLAAGCTANTMLFIAIGDAKSPADFALDGCDYYSLERQAGLRYATATQVPTGHYARKNIGYLIAMETGADFICETDDDNYPYEGFFQPLPQDTEALTIAAGGWTNVYAYYSDSPIWPRGFPLDGVRQPPAELPTQPEVMRAPIQQALADDNPDVDAVYRLTRPLPVIFHEGPRRIGLGPGSWCPFNSQATVHYAPAYPLLYLPAYCSFRMTDIWRSFVAQRIAWTCGWHILFREATVRQDRNEHDLMRDFAEEIPGYLHNRAIAAMLEALPLMEGEAAISANMRRCYRAIVDAGHVGAEELPLLDAWLDDCAAIK